MQRQPTSDGAGVSKIVLRPATIECSITRGVWTTTRREALGLEIDKHISSDFRTLQIVQKGKGAEIQPYLKTQNGERQVDLCTSLRNMLRDYVGDRHAGYLFRTSTGNLLGQSNILRDSLHPLLESTDNESGGSTSSRDFAARTSKRQNVRKFCVTSGQAMRRRVSERYIKLLTKRDWRLQWAERIGLGFELPGANLGQLAQLIEFRKVG